MSDEEQSLKITLGDLTSQLSRLLPLMLLIYIPIVLGLIVLVNVYLIKGIPLRIFFIDPVAEFNAPMYVGLISNLGVLIWCAASAVCLFSGLLIWKRGENRELALFLISGGLISGLLTVDDLYLLHEEVLPDHLFIPQKMVFVGYGLIVLAFLIRFAKTILSTDFVLLGLAFVFFAGSAFVDLFVEPENFNVFGLPGRHIIEDGFKLLGITTWSVYFARTSFQILTSMFDRHN